MSYDGINKNRNQHQTIATETESVNLDNSWMVPETESENEEEVVVSPKNNVSVPFTSQFDSAQPSTSMGIIYHQTAISENEEESATPPSPKKNVILTPKMERFVNTTGKVITTKEDERAVNDAPGSRTP